MCGIIFGSYFAEDKKDNKEISDFIAEQYQDQRSRGIEGYGIIAINENRKYKLMRNCDEIGALVDLKLLPLKQKNVNSILFHHRNPTSTDNMVWQTHPIWVENDKLKYDYLVVHNGVITNDEETKEKHEKAGYKYNTYYEETTENYKDKKFNDSECVAIEMARIIEGKIKESSLTGSASFIALQLDKKTEEVLNVFFGRHTSPLNMACSQKQLLLSSEGVGNEIKEDMIYEFDFKTKEIVNKVNIKIIKPYEYERTEAEEKAEEKANGTTDIDTTKVCGFQRKKDKKWNDYNKYYAEEDYEFDNKGVLRNLYTNMPKVFEEQIEEEIQEQEEKVTETIVEIIADFVTEISLTKDYDELEQVDQKTYVELITEELGQLKSSVKTILDNIKVDQDADMPPENLTEVMERDKGFSKPLT